MTQLVTPPPPCADKGKTVAIGLFAHLRRTALLALLLAFGWAAQAQTGQNLTVKVNSLEALTAQASLEAAIAASKVPLNQISSIVVQAGTFTADDWKYLRDNKKQLSALTAFQIDVEASIPNSDGSAGAYFSNKLNTFSAQSLKKIGAYAFMNCNALSFVYIPAVDTIENSAFSSCISLRSIAFGSVKAVGSKAFAGCTKLTMASLGVEKLSAEVFNNCSALASVELTSVTEIYNAFKGCVSLTTLKLDMEDAPTVKYPNHAFQDCPTVRYLEIADSKKSIYKQIADGNTSDDLWYGWDFATSPDLLTGVLSSKTEGDHNFSNSNSIEEAIESTGVVYSDIEKIKITSGSFLPRDWYFLRAFRKDITKLHTIEILTPTEVPSTKSGDPFVNTNFGSLIAPQATSIGDYAFYKCNFYIVNLLNVQRIGSGVFANNANLHTVTLPNVTSIGSKAFENCKNLGNIKLPYAPPTVSNENAFTGCPTPRFLKFVKSDGSNPTSSTEDQNAVTAAVANYKAVQDGDNTDEFWYGWGMEPYEKLKAKINGGDEIEYSSLQSVISNSGISKDQITSIEITAGNFLQADWVWLQGQKNALTQLQTFKVATLVEIPNSKESYFNAKLTEFDAPEAIGVGSHAFDGCVNLATINLPKVKTIGASAFKRCENLDNFTLPEVETIGNSAFDGAGLTKIDFATMFPKATNIGTGLFASNAKLTNVNWNKNEIGDFMFVRCISLVIVRVSKTLSVKIGERAFYGCEELGLFDSWRVSNIGKEAFCGCKWLRDFNPFVVASIGDNAFQDCRQLTTLKLTATAPTVGVDAFKGCPSPRFLQLVNNVGNPLTGADLDNARAAYMAVSDGDMTDNLWYGWCFVDPVQLTIKVNGGEEEFTGNSLQQAVSSSGAQANQVTQLEIVSGDFMVSDALYMQTDLANVEKLTMSAEMHVLGVEFNHPKLKEFSGPEIKSVASYVFQNCTSLATVSLPAATSIGDYAFYECNELTTANFPAATSIGDYAFCYCYALANVSLPAATSIGDYAFLRCGTLTEVSLPKATSIARDAFYGCSKLTTVSLPEATSIGSYAFYECSKLTTVSLPKAISIESSAFNSCTTLTTVSMPVVTSIDEYAFIRCRKLTTVSLPEATSIGSGAFNNCTTLTTVSLPKATSIGSNAFYECSKLTTVSLPKAISIESGAFNSCTTLTTVSMPVVTSIDQNAFRGCSSLADVKLGDTPPTVSNSNAFMNCPSPRSLTLVDADGNLLTGDELATAQAAYRAAADDDPTDNLWYGWSLTDAYVIAATPSPAEGGSVDGVGSYTRGSSVTLTATANEGYKFVRWTDGGTELSTANPYTFECTASRTLVAVFEKIEYYVIAATASPAEGGSVDGVGSYISGSSVTLTATANEGYKFVRWTGGGIELSTANPYTFVCTASRTLQAVFEKEGGEPTINTYTLSYTASAGGSIKGASVQKVKHGESGTEVEAMASDGHRFVKWSDGLTTAKRTDTNVAKNLSVTAEFEKKEEGGATGLFDAHLESLSVYPNPTQGAVQVEATGMVLVYNINGQLLQRVPSQGKVLIDLSGYPDGMYFIRVGNARAKVVKK